MTTAEGVQAKIGVAVLAGGYGGAKLSHGLALASATQERAGHAPLELSVIVNVGDDLELHGLNVSPDLDTVMYTLAGLADDDHGWGVRDETWSAAAMLETYGAATWFRLGDRDLGTHIRRTEALRGGSSLTEVTAELTQHLGIGARLLPATDDRIRTRIRSGTEWLDFQEYFVKRGQRDRVDEVRYDGIEAAAPTSEVLASITKAALILIAPSNPVVSVGTILAIPGMAKALRDATARVVAVSPIVGGKALRGPADRMLASLGARSSASGVAAFHEQRHQGVIDRFIIDVQDADEAAAVAATGVEVEALDTVMRSHADRERLAQEILASNLPAWP